MAEHDELVDTATRILWDWCHEKQPGPITDKRIIAMGVLHGEVLRLRAELANVPR